MKINNILEILKLENLDPFEPCNGEALRDALNIDIHTAIWRKLCEK